MLTPSVCVATPKRITGRASLRYWFNDPCVARYLFERYNDPCVARYWFERYNDPCVAANVIVKLFSQSFLKSFFSIRARFQY